MGGMNLRIGIAPLVMVLLVSRLASAQVLSVGGGKTIRAATKHDYARLELNFDWIPELWRNDSWVVDLQHAVSVAGFWDENSLYMASWAPNLICKPANASGYVPYLQLGLGVALLSDKTFQSQDSGINDDGTSNMGSYAQFESSLALGVVRGDFGIRARVYHISNAQLADENDGMDVAEFGISYHF